MPAGEVPIETEAPSQALVHLPRIASDPPDVRRSDVDGWGRSEQARATIRRLFDPIYEKWFRVEWEGLDKIPTSGGALLVANHAGAIPVDAPIVMHGIERELNRAVYGLGEQFFRATPLISTLWARGGGVLAQPDNAYRLLRDEGQLVLDFPEGARGPAKPFNQRYQLLRFGRGGFVETAMRSGVPIVPIAIIGSEESMPVLWKSDALAKVLGVPYAPLTANMLLLGPLGLFAYFPAKFKLRVLDPVRFDNPPDLPRYAKSEVLERAEGIRNEIQRNLYEMLEQRQSVWFG
jgi:1-acyl-sn-glycerol-3-phosphate acyltransferase